MAQEGDLSKLFSTPFWLNFNTPYMDQFLHAKPTKKLDYWSTMHLSLACKFIICNHVHLSTLWFFITIWGGSNKILRRIHGAIYNYLWWCKYQLTWTCVSWKEYRHSHLQNYWWTANLLEDDTNITHPCQWVGLYKDGEEDPMFILQSTGDISPSCMHHRNLTLALSGQMLHNGYPLLLP